MKVISFSQQGPRTICILSANGVISSVTLRQPNSSGGTLTYEVIHFLFILLFFKFEKIMLRMARFESMDGPGAVLIIRLQMLCQHLNKSPLSIEKIHLSSLFPHFSISQL